MSSDSFWTAKFALPRYAIVWLGYAFMRALVRLPFGWQQALGRAFGRAAYTALPARRRIAARNIEACLKELPPERRERLLEQHFEALGLSIVEMAMGWFGDPAAVRARISIDGAEHLAQALARGRGAILFSAHFTTFEFFWPALRPLCTKLCGMYKIQRNPVMNRVMNQGRGRYYDTLFAKDNVRQMLRCLRENSVVWYASDQSYGGKGSVLLPFFGEPAMTNTAIARIAKASGAVVLPYFCRRTGDGRYVMNIGAPLDDWPSGDDVEDTKRFIALLERYILGCPEQYWWIHQRFKGRPEPLPDFYAASSQKSAAERNA
jgi:KDO2-lipid IV(A) lauroyltransferase